MENFLNITGLSVEWVQPKMSKEHYELKSGNLIFATLDYAKRRSSGATGETSGGRWKFVNEGVLHPVIKISKDGEEQDIAVFTPATFSYKGILKFKNGGEYNWKSENLFGTKFTFSGKDGREIMKIKCGLKDSKLSDIFKFGAVPEIHPGFVKNEITPLLIILACYLLIYYAEMSSASGAV